MSDMEGEAAKEKLSFDFKKIGLVLGVLILVVAIIIVLSRGLGEYKKKQSQQESNSIDTSVTDLFQEQETEESEPVATEEGKVDIEFESLKEEDEGGEEMDQEQVDELTIEDTLVGDGAEAKIGDIVSVHYTGTLLDGTKFDSSVDRGQPFSFTVGEGRVIQGWEQGVPGMKIGGKRKLTIPSDLGYGDRGSPPVIPPNATLIFEIELLGIE